MDIPGASGAESLALQIIIEADDCFIDPCISLRSFVKRHNKVRQLGAITLDLCSTAVQANCRKALFFVYAAYFLRLCSEMIRPVIALLKLGGTSFNTQNPIPHPSQKEKVLLETRRAEEF